MKVKMLVCGITLILLWQCAACAQTLQLEVSSGRIPEKGSKVFVSPASDGYDTYLKAALIAKHVPVVIVEDKAQADFIITSTTAESQKASTAKKVILLNWHSNEDASIRVSDAKTGVVVYGYTAVKNSSAHGKKSTAESCAKHLKRKLRKENKRMVPVA